MIKPSLRYQFYDHPYQIYLPMSIDIIYYTIIMYLDLFLTCGSYFAYAILKNFKSNFKTFFFLYYTFLIL